MLKLLAMGALAYVGYRLLQKQPRQTTGLTTPLPADKVESTLRSPYPGKVPPPAG